MDVVFLVDDAANGDAHGLEDLGIFAQSGGDVAEGEEEFDGAVEEGDDVLAEEEVAEVWRAVGRG